MEIGQTRIDRELFPDGSEAKDVVDSIMGEAPGGTVIYEAS